MKTLEFRATYQQLTKSFGRFPAQLRNRLNGGAASLLTGVTFTLQKNGSERFSLRDGDEGVLLQLLLASPPVGNPVVVTLEELGIIYDTETRLSAVYTKAAEAGLVPCSYGTLPMLLLSGGNLALNEDPHQSGILRLVLCTEPIDRDGEKLFGFRTKPDSGQVMVTTSTGALDVRICELFADEGFVFGKRTSTGEHRMSMPAEKKIGFIFSQQSDSEIRIVGRPLPLEKVA